MSVRSFVTIPDMIPDMNSHRVPLKKNIFECITGPRGKTALSISSSSSLTHVLWSIVYEWGIKGPCKRLMMELKLKLVHPSHQQFVFHLKSLNKLLKRIIECKYKNDLIQNLHMTWMYCSERLRLRLRL